ncbi:short-chain dehydrogenase/reductase SDR [mine drainage metagenome]|uniref:Short-chain dehydrogenase/reductase SDR n=1 Tax=mine drainage metagenome TaxID=410659 RepID=T1BE59_9ZZZZ
MQLNQIKAVISGGASGLGHAVAEHLLRQGARVCLLDINAERGAQAAQALGPLAQFLRTDVGNEDEVTANLARAAETMGGLNAAISCAGILGAGRVLGKEGPMPLSSFARTVGVNLIGSFNLAKAAANLMQHNAAGEDGERGVIVFTASIAAFEGKSARPLTPRRRAAWWA